MILLWIPLLYVLFLVMLTWHKSISKESANSLINVHTISILYV
ncbi:hypothetical protein MTBBW1_1230014 [Desulfamplus magnetovallimortis]|uniref:Uncharacterized protein n=1 Tax=Desulfamplus magnetovallimortis TaxID=1246637 RepID=A0A1W1H6F1_9BACT|nr:hypothetical protein MTBBW1_1230014 [Desulfamplus magnetovallimortis]